MQSAVKWSRRRTWGMAHGHTNSSEFGLPVGDGAQGFGSFNVDNYSDSIETESTFWFRAWQRWPEIVLIWVWMVINIALFMYHFISSREKPVFHLLGYGLCVAKGSSGVLKFNLALVILPACRRFMAFIRTLCPRLFPSFDHNIWFHRLIGVCIALNLLLHCGGHILWNFGRLTSRSHMEDVSKYASWALDGHGQQYTYAGLLTRHSAAITGGLMLLIFIIALPLASRRTRWTLGNMLPKRLSWLTSLGAFWHTHYLLLLVYPLVIFHGTHGPWYNFTTTTTWCWVLGPLLMYMVELFLQKCTTSISWRTVEVTKAVLHAGGVLALHMSRPSGFLYHTGMYIYLHCSAASRFHWRPMWLMSSPSDSELVVHVKSGDEGNDALIEKFRKCLTLAEGVQIAFVAIGRGHHVAHLVNHSPVPARHIEPGPTKLPGQLDERAREEFPLSIRIWERMFPKILLDGPFNIPTQNYKKYPVLVLIGVDFNVTYFTSVVRELLRSTNLERSCIDEPQDEDDSTSLRVNVEVSGSGGEATTAGHSWRRGMDASARKPAVKKIYLVWSTQEQQSLTWFREEMDTLAAADSQGVLELHQYLTALRREGDSRSLLLKLAQSLKPHDSGIDPATGNSTQVQTHFGTPHWDAIFRKLAADHPLEQLGLFFSGPNATSLDLAFKAREYTAISRTGTRFDYHKELF